MYTDVVTTQDEALCHLFLHCCFEDGKVEQTEIDALAGKFAGIGLDKVLNFRDEVVKYKSYKHLLANETEYVEYLLNKIHATNELALFSYCVELSLSDSRLDVSEETLLNTIADVLDINESYREAIQALIAQRNVVEKQKLF